MDITLPSLVMTEEGELQIPLLLIDMPQLQSGGRENPPLVLRELNFLTYYQSS